jgi:hypothetical protein
MHGMPLERCLRCGTPRRGDLQVCVRCEAPFDEVTADDVDLALPRPAAPSPTQSHGTVMAGLLAGFVVLAVLLYLSVRGVGPFKATVTGSQVTGTTAHLTVTISNEGRKAGHAKCRVPRYIGDDAQPDFGFLSVRVPAHGTITQTVDVPLPQGERTGQVSC